MTKDLVLCFEGTSQSLGIPPPSNVIKLFSMLDQSSQICYYQPGIGTIYDGAVPDIDSQGHISYAYNTCKNTIDAAFALSFEAQVEDAYLFLMRHWEPNSKIYIFGFSRGGYAARVLSGFLECFGLFRPGQEKLVPTAWKVYKEWEKAGRPERDASSLFLLRMKKLFGREARIHFLGVWDTVNLVGIFRDRIFPFTACTSIVNHVRHAASIDERRTKFKHAPFDHTCVESDSVAPVWSNIETWMRSWWSSKPTHVKHSDDIVEVWFPGQHGDIGGGWDFDEEGKRLSEVAFRWMLGEACKYGLRLDETRIKEYWAQNKPNDSILLYHHDMLSLRKSPHKESESFRLSAAEIVRFNGHGNASLFKTIGWWLLEIFPFSTKMPDLTGRWNRRFWPNFGHRRQLPENAIFHWTVFFRMSEVKDYRPRNVPFQCGTSFVDLLKRTGAEFHDSVLESLKSLNAADIRRADLSDIWKQIPDDLARQVPTGNS